MFGVFSVPSECNMLLLDLIDSKPNLVLAREKLDEMARLSYLGSISLGGHITDVYSRTHDARLTFANLKHVVGVISGSSVHDTSDVGITRDFGGQKTFAV